MPAYSREKATDIPSFINVVNEIARRWSDPERGAIRLWFRGQSDASWGLEPGEYRNGISINADQIRSEFHLRALPLLKQVPGTDWEWYFLMQHYGLPTRLLDWTTGSLLGLYFAVRSQAGTDAAVWIVDPWELNKKAVRKAELLFASDSKATAYLPKLYTARRLPDRAVAIVPPHNSDRITVQRGAFTVHGRLRDGIEGQFAKRLVKVVIPKLNAITIKRDLRTAGIGEFTVFPDLVGLCEEIRAGEIEGC